MPTRTEGQSASDVYLPVRLKNYNRDKIIIHELRDPSGPLMSSAEILDTRGGLLYAIEDGEITFDVDNAKIFLLADDTSNGARRWEFLGVSPRANQGEGKVSAGDVIGQIGKQDLVFMAFTNESPTVALSATESEQLPVDPIAELDALDVLPLPQDQDKLLTSSERKELSERLTDEQKGLSREAKIGLAIGGSLLGVALAVKVFSK
jgi:hypothetical protein